MYINQKLTQEFNLRAEHTKNIVSLIDESNTLPFIARYRKEMTGSIDDQILRELNDRLEYLRNLQKRKEEVTESITAQSKMTPELEDAITATSTLAEIEDIYRPYRPKRRTRATIAMEKGLEPLAKLIFAQNITEGTLEELAAPYINSEKEVNSPEEAIAGAKDIIAEQISDTAEMRKIIRTLLHKDALLTTKGTTEDTSVYELYYEYTEPVSKIPPHRILAINRGEKEGFLKVSIDIEEEKVIEKLNTMFVKSGSLTTTTVAEAVLDSWKRLIDPSVSRELRNELTDKASEQAIAMFGANLKPLLLQPPLKGKVTLGLDPAYRTGCKIAVVDATGKVLAHTVIYPTPPQNRTEEAKATLKELIKKYDVEVISIGNGTASKESEIFVAELIKESEQPLSYMVVNEAGASVYSASPLAAKEMPNYDVSIRSAVSIARRLQDPLAELVKIDPKAIGVGQYQHDMPENRLDSTLQGVVEDCVNKVGVNLNTASPALLTHISGLNSTIAQNIVAFREENGAFSERKQLKKVARLGPKAYEQCAGFLRIPNAKNILDNTSVHPESYEAAVKLLEITSYTLLDVSQNRLNGLEAKVKEMGTAKVAQSCGIGLPTLKDIITELQKPGRDLRDELPPPLLRTDIMDIKDLKAGMELTGTVRNVIDFGAFVDIGVHQDGLVHISQMTDKFIKHPSEVVKVGDLVKVRVLMVDLAKNRISLTMKL